MSYSLEEAKRFEEMNTFVAARIRTCMYRFYKVIQTRKAEIPKIASKAVNQATQKQAQQKILGSVDEYVNCLRSQHRGGEIPQYLKENVNAFKTEAYTNLDPQYVLEDRRLLIAKDIFNHNYK